MTDKDMEQACRRIKTLRKRIMQLDASKQALEKQLKDEMQQRHETLLMVGPFKISCAIVVSEFLDTNAIREGAPDLARLYTLQRQSLRMTIT